MPLMENAICKFTEDIWTTILKLNVRRISCEEMSDERENDLIGFVHVTGAWEGSLAIQCPNILVRRAAAVMFNLDPGKVSVREVRGVLGELAHMLVGNLKVILPRPSYISFPMVTEWGNSRPWTSGCRSVCQITFTCEGYPFRVNLLEQVKEGRSKRGSIL